MTEAAARTFDKYADDGAYHWRQINDRWSNGDFHPPLVARYLALVDLLQESPNRVVEVGCGDGALLYLVSRARPSAELFGVDPEAEGVRLAKGEIDKAGVRCDVRIGSAYELPFEDGSVDTVLMADVIEHLEEPDRALEECRRVLPEGGVLLLSTPHRQPDFIWDEANHVHEYDGPEMRALLEPHFSKVELSACYAMRWMRRWRRGSLHRQYIRALARFGYNPLSISASEPSVDYGQIIARCVR